MNLELIEGSEEITSTNKQCPVIIIMIKIKIRIRIAKVKQVYIHSKATYQIK